MLLKWVFSSPAARDGICPPDGICPRCLPVPPLLSVQRVYSLQTGGISRVDDHKRAWNALLSTAVQ